MDASETHPPEPEPVDDFPSPSDQSFEAFLKQTLDRSVSVLAWVRLANTARHCMEQLPIDVHPFDTRRVLALEALWTYLHRCRPRVDRERSGPPQIPDIWKSEIIAARHIPGQGLCVLRNFIHTLGLCTRVRLDDLSIDFAARYCFPKRDSDPRGALLAWDGQGDPPGNWIKEKQSGRPNPNYERDA